jgi:predicted nucleic acid-binding protein
VQQRLRADGRPLGAPEIIDLEVLQVLRREVLRGGIDADQAAEALEIFDALPLERFSHQIVSRRIWSLRDNLTAYDGAYIALAELLDAPLWTRDSKLRGVPGALAQVEIV